MNLRTVRNKIKSVKNVKKITKAMQLVSAVKMKKSVEQDAMGKPYRQNLAHIFEQISGRVDTTSFPLCSKNDAKSKLAILISSNKGLCGSFNINILKKISRTFDFTKTDFITLGSRGAKMILSFDRDIKADFSSHYPLNQVDPIINFAKTSFLAGHYNEVVVVYTRYISATKSEVLAETLLPAILPATTKSSTKLEASYIIEPTPAALLEPLILSFISETLRGAVISSEACEHSSRMLAMKNATDNATEVVSSLTKVGNGIRQSKITNELLDMITASSTVS